MPAPGDIPHRATLYRQRARALRMGAAVASDLLLSYVTAEVIRGEDREQAICAIRLIQSCRELDTVLILKDRRRRAALRAAGD